MASVEEIMAAADPDQVAMMAEEVILVDPEDKVLGRGSKKDTHLNVNIEAGMLHRAFSVFMFNQAGQLLLQKRADTKITFPSYWANTCCSHPLHIRSELDGVKGVINAARRKLEQELGINPEQVPADCFHFLTKVHYLARSDAIWGEHEVDYILICTPPTDPIVNRNANEVAETRWFSPKELRAWVEGADSRGDLVSPWFRIIERTLLHKWWTQVRVGDLSQFVDGLIHRAGDFDKMESAPVASETAGAAAGGAAAGSAAPATAVDGDASKKQGAYGKVQVHKESTLSQLAHIDEVFAALRYKIRSKSLVKPLPAGADPDDVWCEDMLCKVSRSFATVIQQLPAELRLSIGIFYLVLRGLDTVEDDMEAFPSLPVKVRELRAFAGHLQDPTWTMTGVGLGDEAKLLEGFNAVVRAYLRLPVSHQDIIRDITERMASGMADFVGRDLRQGTNDVPDYNLYCHYVAGLVGEGLSRLFSVSQLEAPHVGTAVKLANDMGLFLQKTNIIRDYLEDFVDGRAFWPKTIWGKYGTNLGDFAYGANRQQGLACLNDMVTDALVHAPKCLEYMAQLRNQDVFNFCAVPQVMAIATLEQCFNNPKVFTGVVKIRKGTAAKLILTAKDMESLAGLFLTFVRSMRSRVNPRDPNASTTHTALNQVEEACFRYLPARRVACSPSIMYAVVALFVALAVYLHGRVDQWESWMPRLTDSADVLAVAGLVFCMVFLLSFAGVPLAQNMVAGGKEVPSPVSSPVRAATSARS